MKGVVLNASELPADGFRQFQDHAGKTIAVASARSGSLVVSISPGIMCYLKGEVTYLACLFKADAGMCIEGKLKARALSMVVNGELDLGGCIVAQSLECSATRIRVNGSVLIHHASFTAQRLVFSRSGRFHAASGRIAANRIVSSGIFEMGLTKNHRGSSLVEAETIRLCAGLWSLSQAELTARRALVLRARSTLRVVWGHISVLGQLETQKGAVLHIKHALFNARDMHLNCLSAFENCTLSGRVLRNRGWLWCSHVVAKLSHALCGIGLNVFVGSAELISPKILLTRLINLGALDILAAQKLCLSVGVNSLSRLKLIAGQCQLVGALDTAPAPISRSLVKVDQLMVSGRVNFERSIITGYRRPVSILLALGRMSLSMSQLIKAGLLSITRSAEFICRLGSQLAFQQLHCTGALRAKQARMDCQHSCLMSGSIEAETSEVRCGGGIVMDSSAHGMVHSSHLTSKSLVVHGSLTIRQSKVAAEGELQIGARGRLVNLGSSLHVDSAVVAGELMISSRLKAERRAASV